MRDFLIEYKAFTSEDLVNLSTISKQIVLNQGDILFKEKDPGTALYIVLLGKLQLSRLEYGKSVTIGDRNKGEIVGYLPLFVNNGIHRYTTIAEEKTVLMEISNSKLEKLSRVNPQLFGKLIVAIMLQLVDEFADISKQLDLLIKGE